MDERKQRFVAEVQVGPEQYKKFPAVDEVRVEDRILRLTYGPQTECFPLERVWSWLYRPQTPEEARVTPSWERIEGTKGANS